MGNLQVDQLVHQRATQHVTFKLSELLQERQLLRSRPQDPTSKSRLIKYGYWQVEEMHQV